MVQVNRYSAKYHKRVDLYTIDKLIGFSLKKEISPIAVDNLISNYKFGYGISHSLFIKELNTFRSEGGLEMELK